MSLICRIDKKIFFSFACVVIAVLAVAVPTVSAKETYFQPAVGDIRWGSAGPERVLVTDDGGWFATTYQGASLFKTTQFFAGEVIIASPLLANVTGDALDEIIFVTRGADGAERMIVLDGAGATLFAAPLGEEHITGDPIGVREGNRAALDAVLGTKSGKILQFRVAGSEFSSTVLASLTGPVGVGTNEFHTEFIVTWPDIAAAARYAWSGSAWMRENELALDAPLLYHAVIDGANIYGVNTRGEIAAFDKQTGVPVANFPVAVSGFPVAAPQLFEFNVSPGKEIMAPLAAGTRAIIGADGTVLPSSGASRGVKRSQIEGADNTIGALVNGSAAALGTSYAKSLTRRTMLSPLSRGVLSTTPPTFADKFFVYQDATVPTGSSITLGSFTIGAVNDFSVGIRTRGPGDLVLTGNEPVTLTNTSGDAFTLLTKPASLIPAGTEVPVTIRFAPQTGGQKSATLMMRSFDPLNPVYTITLLAREAALSGAPENFTAAPHDGSVSLAWQSGADDVTDYIIEYRPVAGSGVPFSEDVNTVRILHTGVISGITISPLTNGVAYEFRAAAINSLGTGAFTAPITATPALPPIMLEDAEDGQTDGWFVSEDGAPGTVTNDQADAMHGRVITLNGNWNNVFIFKNADGTWWEKSGYPVLSYETSMESLIMVVKIITSKGDRQIIYTPYASGPQSPPSFQIDSRSGIPDGAWRPVLRNIAQDLAAREPDAELVSVDGLFFRGGGMIDNIRLLRNAALYTVSGGITNAAGNPMPGVTVTLKPDNRASITDGSGRYMFTGLAPGEYHIIPEFPTIAFAPSTSDITVLDQSMTRDFIGTEITSLVYEDAEDGDTNGWVVSDDGLGGAIANVFDETKGSRVIALDSDGWNAVFGFQHDDGTPWRLEDYSVVEFDTMTDGNIVTINVETTKGDRSLSYDPRGVGGVSPSYRFDGRTGIPEGVWRTVSFDVGRDIAAREPGTTLVAINSIRMRGSAKIDTVIFRKTPTFFAIYGTVHDASGNPLPDTRVTLAPQGREVRTDAEGAFRFAGLPAGTYTLALEKALYTFTGIPSSVVITNQSVSLEAVGGKPDRLVMEDAEDGLTTPWVSDPGGVIENTLDPEKGRVISFTAPGTGVQYTLLNPDGAFWRIAGYTGVAWDMRFLGTVYFYIPIDTTAGDKVLLYSPNFLAPSTNGFIINMPLPGSNNGAWQTITRDIEADLKSILPEAELQSIKYFGVRGNGSVDTVALIK